MCWRKRRRPSARRISSTLIESAIDALRGRKRVAVIEGDIETDIDAARIRKRGVLAHQIDIE